MRRVTCAALLAIAAVGALILMVNRAAGLAAPTSRPAPPELPKDAGYCVSVEDEDGSLLGVTDGLIPFPKPDHAKLGEFTGTLRNAITLIGHAWGRQDVIHAAGDVRLIDNPLPPLHKPRPPRQQPNDATIDAPDGCYMSCKCATVYLVTPALTLYDSAGDATMRQRSSGAGGNVGGCAGGCGACEKCRLVCPGGQK